MPSAAGSSSVRVRCAAAESGRDARLDGGKLPLDLPQPRFDVRELVAGHEGADEADGQHRSRPDDVVGEVADPATDGGLLSISLQGGQGSLDEVAGSLDVAGGQRVAHGGNRLAGPVVPLAGAQVEAGDQFRVLVAQMRPEDVGEQLVVPVPLPLVVERPEEQVRPFQGCEHGPAAGLLEDGIAEVGTERVEDRRPRQEVANLVGLAGQDLVDEVVDDIPVVAREPGDETGDVVPALHGQGGELQRGRPPFGPGPERGHVVGSDGQPADVGQVGRGLVDGEAQVSGSDLDELAACPQPCQREVGVCAGADHDVQVR